MTRSSRHTASCINLQPSLPCIESSTEYKKFEQGFVSTVQTNPTASSTADKMTRLLISVLDERRDPYFDSYPRGLPAIESSKDKEYVIDIGRYFSEADETTSRLEPRRGDVGSDVLGPQNPEKQRQNRDLFCPPETDHGKMPNMKW